MLFQRYKLPESALLLIFHIFFLLYLHSKFVTNIWPNSIVGIFQFCFTYDKFHSHYIKKDKCGEGTFELVRVRFMYFTRLLSKSKNLQLSNYKPYLFHLPFSNFLSSVFPTQTCCSCPLPSCLGSPGSLVLR